jgi:hypothetical protein
MNSPWGNDREDIDGEGQTKFRSCKLSFSEHHQHQRCQWHQQGLNEMVDEGMVDFLSVQDHSTLSLEHDVPGAPF